MKKRYTDLDKCLEIIDELKAELALKEIKTYGEEKSLLRYTQMTLRGLRNALIERLPIYYDEDKQ